MFLRLKKYIIHNQITQKMKTILNTIHLILKELNERQSGCDCGADFVKKFCKECRHYPDALMGAEIAAHIDRLNQLIGELQTECQDYPLFHPATNSED